MSEHDPLCATHIKGLPDISTPCHTCALISRVRGDERYRIIDIIQADCAHTKYIGVRPCVHDRISANIERDRILENIAQQGGEYLAEDFIVINRDFDDE